MIKNTSPEPNCAEISLFGPGVGECLVLHYGEGRWFIIDSCLCPKSKKPVALQYLQSIGVDVSCQVVGILITHWHLDHIEGAFTLLQACSNAKLYCSSALTTKEAFQLISLYKRDSFANIGKNFREFREIIDFLRETNDRDRLVPVKVRHTFFDDRKINSTRLVALSPSNASFVQSVANITELTPKKGAQRTRNIVPINENLNAVALHFSYNNFSALLGSDLEETKNPQTGWSAIFGDKIINELSLPIATLFKVAHHGSETGYHKKTWEELLIKSPISITTTNTRSNLPTTNNINKLKSLSSCFLVTKNPKANRKIKRESIVERELRSIAKNRKTINDKMGHIQIRISIDGDIKMSRNENAIEFTNLNC